VTGGSRGIGAATARLAARQGYAVAINYRTTKESAAAVVAEIQSTGGRAIAVQADVSQEREVERLFEEVDRRLGRLSALVNSAGIDGGPETRIADLEQASLERLFAVNVIGTMLCCRDAACGMATTHGVHRWRHGQRLLHGGDHRQPARPESSRRLQTRNRQLYCRLRQGGGARGGSGVKPMAGPGRAAGILPCSL
jgi:NAD(P)-dependent dehydrogenase (short-subunit alcohol dehydrogenase family)